MKSKKKEIIGLIQADYNERNKSTYYHICFFSAWVWFFLFYVYVENIRSFFISPKNV